MTDASEAVAYKLKLSVRGISPMIWRRLVVPSDLTLYGLHRAIQIVFGWEDYHLHAFHVQGRRHGTEWTGQRHYAFDEKDDLYELRMSDLSLRLRGKFVYEYDFGDCWEHEVRLEARDKLNPAKPYPICIGGARAGPPEDIGGPMGYNHLLERLDEVRFDRLLYGGSPLPGEELDGEEEFAEDYEWGLAGRNGFDGPDDPLLCYDPELFDRRAVNLELRDEFASGPMGSGKTSEVQTSTPS